MTDSSVPSESSASHSGAAARTVDRAIFDRYIAGSKFALNTTETEWAWAGWQIRGLFEREAAAERIAARSGPPKTSEPNDQEASAGIPLNASGDETGAHLGAVQRPRGTTD